MSSRSDEPGVADTQTQSVAASLQAPGARIGRFVVAEMLGQGGAGVVLAAYDPVLDRTIALKLLRPLPGDPAVSRERLLREAKALARLSHPNVLTVHDAGTHEEQVFIAMEYAAGGTLTRWLRAQRRPWREVLERFVLAGRGLQAAHDAGLVHRDFKPDNVLLTADGGVRVADFGLVGGQRVDADGRAIMAVGSLTEEGMLLGTPRYMAPEQHDGGKVGPAADQFAFCVALYEGLHGEHPFGGTSYPELAASVREGNVRKPAADSEVPPWLMEAIERGLQTKPQDRWPSMAALLEALGADAALAALAASVTDPERRARSAELRRRLHQANQIGEAGNYDQGVALVEAVAREADTLGVSAVRAEALYALGSLQEEAGDLKAAEHSLTEAAVEAGRARDDGLAARIWGDLLVVVGYRSSRPAHALLLRPAAEAAMVRCGDDPAARGRFLNSLGTVQFEHGQWEEARRSFEQSTAMNLEAFGPADLQVGNAANNEGFVLIRLARHEEARARLERARGIWENLFGRDHPQLAIALNNLGELAFARGELAEALALHEQALAIREKFLRAGHPFLGLSLYNLGRTLLALGHLDEAIAHHEDALAIRKDTLGNEHPDVADSLAGLAKVHSAQGEHDQARQGFERALSIAGRTLGPDHPRIAVLENDFGEAARAAGDGPAATRHHQRALAIAQRALGPDHPEVARAERGLS